MPRDEFFDDDETDNPYWEEQHFHDIWQDTASESVLDQIGDRTYYSAAELEQAHAEVFFPYIEGEEHATQEELWKDYIEVMVNGEGDRDAFFHELGIYESDFDWEAWREAMGYE